MFDERCMCLRMSGFLLLCWTLNTYLNRTVHKPSPLYVRETCACKLAVNLQLHLWLCYQ
uniref:Uncharacterized protein n=1 Tax=Aegilops tauschii subsp. strangulata TaxID=200361 RepID=A0A453AHL9_AEGTS